jgi:hypothetical protein
MFIANFLGGPNKPYYQQPINVKITLTEFILYYIMGSEWFINKISKRMSYNYSNDYFGGVRIWIN